MRCTDSPPRVARGFILIYVVAMIAGITLILSQMQQRRAIPQQSERMLQRTLEAAEGEMLLDFVIAGTQSQQFPLDARYLQFRKFVEEDPARAAELADALRQLKEMLSSLGFNIQDRPEGEVGKKARREGEGVLFSVTGQSLQIKLGSRTWQLSLHPGNQRPNLNALPFESLWRDLQALGLEEREARELAASIIDWTDPDDFSTAGIGAESNYYLARSPSYRSRNGPIQNWQELAYVRGIPTERLAQLRENYAIAPSAARKVLATAMPKERLAAITQLKAEQIATLVSLFTSSAEDAARQLDVYRLTLDRTQLDAFDHFVSWEPLRDVVRIELTGPNLTLYADYDVKGKRLIGRW